eukprot:5596622-Prymnesium_polylepis.1
MESTSISCVRAACVCVWCRARVSCVRGRSTGPSDKEVPLGVLAGIAPRAYATQSYSTVGLGAEKKVLGNTPGPAPWGAGCRLWENTPSSIVDVVGCSVAVQLVQVLCADSC